MKKSTIYLIAMLMLTLAVAGCSGAAPAADTAPSSDDAASSSDSAADTASTDADEADSMMVMEYDAMTEECNEDLTGETIVIYQQAGREGPLASILGDGFALATTDAVGYINENGGVCGAHIEVEFGETNYAVEQEIAVYEQFRVADPKPIILLTYGSGATIALKDRVKEDEIVNLAAGLNAEAFYNPADGYTFGSAPIYSDQFAGFLTWASENWADIKPEGAGDDIVVGVLGWANAFGAGATTPEALAVAESLGITVLPLEEQAISPDADVTGQVQNMLLGGANVIYSQNLSFGATQLIGTVRALGAWDQVIVGGVNWAFNVDVVNFLGENQQLADGFYGVFPYRWYDDTDQVGVQLVNDAFAAAGYEEKDRAVTYITTWGTFLSIWDILEFTINEVGYEKLSGATVKASMSKMGIIDGGGISTFDARGTNRAGTQAQIRQMKWDGEKINFEVAADFFELPDTRPSSE
ncbi:MAG: ABC transporter substrate-binding protein [Chloroflexota bacterium]